MENLHDNRCAFNKLIQAEPERQYYELDDETFDQNQLERDANMSYQTGGDPHKQYVAVQQGRDIPLQGLRKPAPQANIYKGKFVSNNIPLSRN